MKKFFLFWCCYFPVLIGCAFHKEAGLAQLAVGMSSFWAGIFILFFQTDIKMYKQFSLHQFVGAAIGYISSVLLFLGKSSNDVASQVVLFIFVIVGLLIVAIQIFIGYIISKLLKRNR